MSENKHDCGCDHAHEHHQHDCDCGCEHDESCDCGCEDEVVMLQDADGNEVAFNYVYNMEHEGKEYVFLQPADEDDEDGIEIFQINTVEEDGQFYDMLAPVDDDLYDILYEKLLLVASEDACEDDDCECHHEHCDCEHQED